MVLYTRTINYNSGLHMASISHLRRVTGFLAMSTTTRVQTTIDDARRFSKPPSPLCGSRSKGPVRIVVLGDGGSVSGDGHSSRVYLGLILGTQYY